MRLKLFFWPAIGVIVLLDAYLLQQQTVVSRFGIWAYDYGVFQSFPKTLATIAGTALLAWMIARVASRLPRPAAIIVATGGVLASLYILIVVFQQFSGGAYQYSGTGFIAGLYLWPLILAAIFGKALWGNLFPKKIPQQVEREME